MKSKILIIIVLFTTLSLVFVFFNQTNNESEMIPKLLESKKNADQRDHNNSIKENSSAAYDPKNCKIDAQGMVYWAAGSHVFKFPFVPEHKLFPRVGTTAETEINVQLSDPSDLEGCPGNPLHGGAMPYMAELSSTIWEQLAGTPLLVEQESGPVFMATEKGVLNFSGPLPKRFLNLYENKENCIERSPGFVECLKSGNVNKNVNELVNREVRISAKARGSRDEDGDLYISADLFKGYDTALTINAAFGMYDNSVSIRYQFKVLPEDLPNLVKFDRIITAMIRKAHQQ